MVVTFDEKVDLLENDIKNRDLLIQGSDEHLDFLLELKNIVDPLTIKIHQFTLDITSDLNSFDNNRLSEAIPKLLDLYSTAIRCVASLKRNPLCKQLKETVQNFSIEVDNLHEQIYDVERFRLSDDEELDTILREINAE